MKNLKHMHLSYFCSVVYFVGTVCNLLLYCGLFKSCVTVLRTFTYINLLLVFAEVLIIVKFDRYRK